MQYQTSSIHRREGEVPLCAHPPLSLDKFIEQSGLSPATCWRYRKRGWLKTIVISGRHYVTREAIADFNGRAANGEFAGRIANPFENRGGAQ
jgi:hypothetical protein